MSIEFMMPSNHLIRFYIFSSHLQSFIASRTFPTSWLFTSGSQNIGTSALASVLSMNIQGWFPLRLAGLISLLSKGVSCIFSSIAVGKFYYNHYHFFSRETWGLHATWMAYLKTCRGTCFCWHFSSRNIYEGIISASVKREYRFTLFLYKRVCSEILRNGQVKGGHSELLLFKDFLRKS